MVLKIKAIKDNPKITNDADSGKRMIHKRYYIFLFYFRYFDAYVSPTLRRQNHLFCFTRYSYKLFIVAYINVYSKFL